MTRVIEKEIKVTNVFWGAIDNGMHGNDNMDRVVPMKMIISMEPFLIF